MHIPPKETMSSTTTTEQITEASLLTISSYEEDYESSPEYPIDCDSTFYERNQAWRVSLMRKIFDECEIYDDETGDVIDLTRAIVLMEQKYDNAELLELYRDLFADSNVEEAWTNSVAIKE